MSPVRRSFQFSEGASHVLGGVGLVVHEEELDVVDVVDEESLVARGRHVAGLLVGAIADLEVAIESVSQCFSVRRAYPSISPAPTSPPPVSPSQTPRLGTNPPQDEWPRTEGMARLPLNRLRTRLSIPLGLRHAASRHLNLSLWWRMKPLVPANRHARQHSCPQKSIADSKYDIPSETTRKWCRPSGGSIGGQRCRLEGRTLLHDRDVLLSGNHLCDLLERSRIGNTELTTRQQDSKLYLDGIVVG